MQRDSCRGLLAPVAFAALLLLHAVAVGAGAQEAAPRQSANVLLSIADDLRPQLGAYDVDIMHAPNIDRLAEEGLIFFTDLLNDDQPYLIRTPSGPIVSIPYSVEINDFMIFFRRGMSTSEASQVLQEQLDELYREGAESGRLMNVGLHPHVTGQPFRIRALREFLEYAKGLEDIWWATREEIATWYLENHDSHIPSS